MTTVTRIYRFEAAHRLPADFGGPATKLHGHSYTLRVEAEGRYPTEAIDRLMEPILEQLDHKMLNDYWTDTTVEGLAETILDTLPGVLAVEVQEGDLRYARATRS